MSAVGSDDPKRGEPPRSCAKAQALAADILNARPDVLVDVTRHGYNAYSVTARDYGVTLFRAFVGDRYSRTVINDGSRNVLRADDPEPADPIATWVEVIDMVNKDGRVWDEYPRGNDE